jgi:hypothetical protein
LAAGAARAFLSRGFRVYGFEIDERGFPNGLASKTRGLTAASGHRKRPLGVQSARRPTEDTGSAQPAL